MTQWWRQWVSIVAGVVLLCGPLTAQTIQSPLDLSGSYPIAGSHLLHEQSVALAQMARVHPEMLSTTALRKTAWSFGVDSTHSWYADDFTNYARYLVPSTCKAVGTNCYVFVEDSSWAKGYVTQAIVDSVRNAFDLRTPAFPGQGIFVVDTTAFGSPPNVDGDPKIIILILDIRDGWSGSGGFVAGYFYSYNEFNLAKSNKAEIYFLDCHPLDMKQTWGLAVGQATTAHEFQHMIHFKYDPNEETFVNEGCSVTAEVNAGYAVYNQNYYIAESNFRLFDWRYSDMNNVLKDYSRAARFFLYYRDQLGMGVFKKIVASPLTGVAGINAGMAAYGTTHRFADLVPPWFVANTLNDRTVDTLYGYKYGGLPAMTPIAITHAVGATADTLKQVAARYIAIDTTTWTGGLSATFTVTPAAPSVMIKAVERGPASKRVLDVTSGSPFTEPLWRSTYTNITFVVINTDTGLTHPYTYQFGITTAVNAQDARPASFALEQNYPNPFNPATMIRYTVAAPSVSMDLNGQSPWVSIKVYDLLGREVATLVNERKNPGTYEVRFDGSRLPSGVYVYRLTAGPFSSTKKLALLK